MFELTDTLTYVVPVMLSVLVAKTVADSLEPKGIYDLVIESVAQCFPCGDLMSGDDLAVLSGSLNSHTSTRRLTLCGAMRRSTK